MGFVDRLRGLLGKRGAPSGRIRVKILIKGRIGAGWLDVDRELALPEGMTLGELIPHASDRGIPLRDAIENSPHLRDTLMWNGERCAVAEHRDRPLADGDTIYLLAPLAGG